MALLFSFFPEIWNIVLRFTKRTPVNHSSAYEWVQRIRLFLAAGAISFLLVFAFPFIKKTLNRYGVLIFIYLLLQLLTINSFEPMNRSSISGYLLSYRDGFASRMFIGTIVDMLSDGFITMEFIQGFAFCGALLLCFCIAMVLGHLIEKSTERTAVLLLSLLYLSSPISPSFYFSYIDIGRMEMYILPVMLLVFFVIDKRIWRWFIPLFCFISLATHLISVFTYMPMVFIILLYKYFGAKNKKNTERYLLILTTVVISLTFLYFVFFAKHTLKFKTLDEFANALKNRTDNPDYGFAVFYEYFLSIPDTFRHIRNHFGGGGGYLNSAHVFLQNTPLFLFFTVFWHVCFISEKKEP